MMLCRQHLQRCHQLPKPFRRRLLHAALHFERQPPLHVTGTIRPGGVDVEVGQYAQVQRVFTPEEVHAFGCVVSDRNPLHTSWVKDDDATPSFVADHMLTRWEDASAAAVDPKNQPIIIKSKVLVHGMLVSSLFTCILGTLIPGCVYLSQTLEFQRPVYANDVVVGNITIVEAEPWTKRPGLRLTCETTVRLVETQKVCVRGQARVWLPGAATNSQQ